MKIFRPSNGAAAAATAGAPVKRKPECVIGRDYAVRCGRLKTITRVGRDVGRADTAERIVCAIMGWQQICPGESGWRTDCPSGSLVAVDACEMSQNCNRPGANAWSSDVSVPFY